MQPSVTARRSLSLHFFQNSLPSYNLPFLGHSIIQIPDSDLDTSPLLILFVTRIRRQSNINNDPSFFLLTGGGGGTPYNGLYVGAPPERGTFFRLQVYKRVGISLV